MRLPLVPTLMVAVMVPVMIGLGFWQLQRAEWKAGLLAELAAGRDLPRLEIAPPLAGNLDFRRVRVRVDCPAQTPQGRAGRSADGRTGYATVLLCRAAGEDILLDAGWSVSPTAWTGIKGPWPPAGPTIIDGMLVKTGKARPRYTLVSETAPPPLLPSAPPSSDTIPNNHMGYAVQWFAFAVTLLIIYGVYVRRRRAAGETESPAK